jgi:site-specific DNA-methyltransferase (adenine-specific)
MAEPDVTLWLGDCLERMGEIADGSIDLILADLPFGTTACRWDVVIPFRPLWEHYRRLLKPSGAVVLHASQPFTTDLIQSNREWFKYAWVWEKNNATGHLNARRRPMMATEDIVVFAPAVSTFNPIPARSNIVDRPFGKRNGTRKDRGLYVDSPYGAHRERAGEKCSIKEFVSPRNLLRFDVVPHSRGTLHPTQKPIPLAEYLIRTHSNPGALILDNAMGSGTTGIACLNTDRRFIGIERDPAIFEVADERIRREMDKTLLLTG